MRAERRGLVALILVVGLGWAGGAAPIGPTSVAAADDAPAARALALGPAGLPEQRTTLELAPGVSLTRIRHGAADPASAWTVTAAWQETDAAAQADLGRLAAAGFNASSVVPIGQRAPDDAAPGPLGYAVRVGSFATRAPADRLLRDVKAAGFADAGVDYTGEDGGPTTGPWAVDVLRIDHAQFRGRLGNILASSTISAGRAPVSEAAPRAGALAGVNGGYFVVGPGDGTPGDPAGISVVDGQLVAEAVDGRTALFLGPTTGHGEPLAQILSGVSTAIEATASDGAERVVNGLDRVPGRVRACGRPGAQPTQGPKHDFTCTDPDELVVYKPLFGSATPAGSGVEAALDADGLVTVLRPRGGRIPPNGTVLTGTGAASDWLTAHAQPGARIRVTERLTADGQRRLLRPGLGVVNGGPRLVRDGHTEIPACAEGFCYPETGRFYWRFGVRRNPRTMVGVTPEGDALLVAVDGHEPDHSVGLSFIEEADVMRALGSSQAINVDGGGSTTMVSGGQVVNVPSDATGERPVGDAIVVLPR